MEAVPFFLRTCRSFCGGRREQFVSEIEKYKKIWQN